MNITSNLKPEQAKNTEYRKTKSLFKEKKIGRKCRLTYISIEQNNDYAQLKHKVRFCSSFKVLKKLIYEQLSDYMETFLSFIFCGFRKAHNTQNALFKLLHY